MKTNEKSQQLFHESRKHFPGGVNSPVRAFGSVGGSPLFIAKAKGADIWDADGNQYVDFVGTWGPAILGHAHPEVVAKVQEAAASGLSFGAPTEQESQLAAIIKSALPNIEKLRFVSSGTEACMSAIRLARAFTKRDCIVKFSGNYHGHSDALLAMAGSGVATFSLPDSLGVPKASVEKTLIAAYNDLEQVEAIFREKGHDIAAIIIEPIVGNSGFIRPLPGFLSGLRKICDRYGALFIVDEVMTGFRVAWGGMQILEDVQGDICCLGKVIGGGLPLAAFGGRAEIMDLLAPLGGVYQAGTLSGNPLATACGIKTLEILQQLGTFEGLHATAKSYCEGLAQLASKHGVPFTYDYQGGMFGHYFSATKITSYEDAKKIDNSSFPRFFQKMLQHGVYLAPSAFEAGFVSTAHTPAHIEKSLAAADLSFKEIARI